MPLPMNRLIEKIVFFGFLDHLLLGAVADQNFAVFLEVNDRRHELAAVRPGNDAWRAVFDNGDQAVCGSEIDSDNFGHYDVSSSSRSQISNV